MVTTDIGTEGRDRGDTDGADRTDSADGTARIVGSGRSEDGEGDRDVDGDRSPDVDGEAASWETVASLPASAKLVARTLEYEGAKSGTDLAAATRLPPRTVRYAVDRLEAVGVVAVRPSLQDAREKRYHLRID